MTKPGRAVEVAWVLGSSLVISMAFLLWMATRKHNSEARAAQ